MGRRHDGGPECGQMSPLGRHQVAAGDQRQVRHDVERRAAVVVVRGSVGPRARRRCEIPLTVTVLRALTQVVLSRPYRRSGALRRRRTRPATSWPPRLSPGTTTRGRPSETGCPSSVRVRVFAVIEAPEADGRCLFHTAFNGGSSPSFSSAPDRPSPVRPLTCPGPRAVERAQPA
jgi:hypothetical protein